MFPINDIFDAFLVGGFLFGVIFTVASVVLGFGHVGGDTDLAHDIGHDVDHGTDHGGLELVNVSSILAFITWFSGVTYLARNGFGWVVGFAILIGLVLGLCGAWLVAWFLYSFLRKNSPELNPAEWDSIGQIGHISGTIFENGIGEMVFEWHGSRHSIPAKTKDGIGIKRDTEVVIMSVDKGIAIVQPWAELMDEITINQG